MRLARAYSGLPDKAIQSLFHALKREGGVIGTPPAEDLDGWVSYQRILIRHAPGLTDAQKARCEQALHRARSENPDPATFYAWQNIVVRARQEAVIRSMKGTVADLAPPGSQLDQYEWGEDGRPAKIWYASYGSNMSRSRFLAYVSGGTPPGSHTKHAGCRDTTEPEDDMPIRFNGRLHFAYESGRWGGGVAFLDDTNTTGHTLGRAYLITAQQFDDIVAQENGRIPGTLAVNTDDVLLHGETSVSKTAIYGTLVHIGDYNGAPVMTFTGNFTTEDALADADRLARDGKFFSSIATNTPTGNYLRMIGAGLAETFHMNTGEQADYLRGAPGATYLTRRRVLNILRTPPDPVRPRRSKYIASTLPLESPSTTSSPDRSPGGAPPAWDRFSDPGRSTISTPTSGSWTFGRPPAAAPLSPPDPLFSEADEDTRTTVFVKTCPLCGKPGHTMHECPLIADADYET